MRARVRAKVSARESEREKRVRNPVRPSLRLDPSLGVAIGKQEPRSTSGLPRRRSNRWLLLNPNT